MTTLDMPPGTPLPGSAPVKRILCIEIGNWVGVERLPIHLSEAGFTVGCLCSMPSAINKVSRLTRYNWQPPIAFNDLLEQAIKAFKPDLLIFLDEPSYLLLAKVIALNPGDIVSRHKELFERSLGDLKTLEERILRKTLPLLAKDMRVAKTIATNSLAELTDFGASIGWRAFFKEEFTCGGLGVTPTESQEKFLDTARQLLNAKKPFVAQEFKPGRTAMRAAVAYQGKVLCGISFTKVTAISGGIGYSTVIKPVQYEEMQKSTEKVAELLGINGPFSCDFMVEEDTGDAYLIEINPRPTGVFHLGYLAGVSFARALGAIIEGKVEVQSEQVPVNKEVALFPKELFRDPTSANLTSAIHDVPWAYPRVVEHYLAMIPGN